MQVGSGKVEPVGGEGRGGGGGGTEIMGNAARGAGSPNIGTGSLSGMREMSGQGG